MATRKILFRGQTRRKGEKTSISGKPLPGIWVTGGTFPQPVKETAKICSLCSPMQRYSLLPASASTPQSSSSYRMWRLTSRTDTELSGLQRPKPENPCMSVKASTMHASMCFAKADTCSGNWLTASCATTKVPISNLRGAIVSRA